MSEPFRTNYEALQIPIELTSQRDRNSLVSHFLSVVSELLKPDTVHLFSPVSMSIIKFGASLEEEKVVVKDLAGNSEETSLDAIQGANECLERLSSTEIDLGNTSRLIYPIHGLGGISAILVVERNTFTREEKDLLSGLTVLFGNLLFMLGRSERDGLTGLYNRSEFDKKLKQIIEISQTRQRRKQLDEKSAFLALLDIDHFKSVNDKHGHLLGDEVLLLFSMLMTKTFRQHDMLFRYGGEEFAVILEGTEARHLHMILDRFRKTVAANNFPQVGEVTVSIGATEISTDTPLSVVIARADRALYYAKEHGRNQVVVYEDLITNQLIEKL